MYYDQTAFDLRLEWGLPGITLLGALVDAIIIVDVLSFSTCVDIATAQGAYVYPYRYRDDSAEDYAREIRAELAGPRSLANCKYSLSPQSLQAIPRASRLVLPSPNGATLSLATGNKPTFVGCLRNAKAMAHYVQLMAKRVLVIPAGERWPDGTLRYAAEDLVGAGAIVAHFKGSMSPEAKLAAAAYDQARQNLHEFLLQTASGRELHEQQFGADIRCAAELNVSKGVPLMKDGAFITVEESGRLVNE